MKNKKVPKIRFKGFVEEWEEKTLGEIIDLKSGRDYKHLSEGNIPVYGTGGYMLSVNEALSYSENAIGIGRKGTINKPYILYAPFWTVDTLFYAIPRNNYDLYFVYDIFQQIDWQSKDESTGVPSLSKVSINAIEINIVKFQEQTQIGNYFQNIDKLIEKSQSKLDKLKNIKKSCLQKMFPKQGATTPEIRFRGFREEWEEKKLGEIALYKNGKGHEDKQSPSGKYELINLNSISIDGGLKLSGKFIDEASETLLKNDLVMVLSDVGHGDLLGRVALIPENNRFVLNQRVALLRLCEPIYPYYLFFNINSQQRYFKLQGAGSSQLNISKECVENYPTYLPRINEQTQIGNFFKNLDDLISKNEQQLTKLKNIKKACLEKMFVNTTSTL